MINERIDDLMRDGLKLIQNTDIFVWNGRSAVVYLCQGREEGQGAGYGYR